MHSALNKAVALPIKSVGNLLQTTPFEQETEIQIDCLLRLYMGGRSTAAPFKKRGAGGAFH